jgi:hypothetical protein
MKTRYRHSVTRVVVIALIAGAIFGIDWPKLDNSPVDQQPIPASVPAAAALVLR